VHDCYCPRWDAFENEWRDGVGGTTYNLDQLLGYMFRDLTFEDGPVEVNVLIHKRG